MRISMVMYQQAQAPVPAGGLNMNIFNPHRHKDKVVIVMGATGTGKSRLSIDLATRYPAEIINSDKMQVYQGLDIVTNKITEEEKCGVPHHLLGIIDPDQDFTSKDFCDVASIAVGSISSRGQLPIIVGGSNSYIEAFINGEPSKFQSKYECCFLWVDVSMPILHSFVSDRVDQMVKNGMIEEVRNMYVPNANYTRGIRRAIGVPELNKYFRDEPYLNEGARKRLLENAIDEIKVNTCKLARRQLDKIYKIRKLKGLNVHRIDATEVFKKRGREADEAWEKLVVRPSSMIVGDFLYDVADKVSCNIAAIRGVAMEIALATATY